MPDEQTEILTDRGWARHDTIGRFSRTGSRTGDNGRVFFEEPSDPSPVTHRGREHGILQCERISVRATEGQHGHRTHRLRIWLKTKAANVIGRSFGHACKMDGRTGGVHDNRHGQ